MYDLGRGWMETEVALVASDKVLTRALDMLGGEARSALSLATLRNKLVVEPIRNTSLLSVRYRSSDPDVAANVVHAVTEAYRAHFQERMQNYASRTLDWLREHLPRLREELGHAQKERIDFQKKLGMLSFGLSAENEPEEISLARELKKEIAGLERQLADYRSKMAAIDFIRKDAGGGLDDGAAARPAFSLEWVRSDPVVAGLLRNERELSTTLAGMLSRLGPRHQDVLEMDARLQEVRKAQQAALAELAYALAAQVTSVEVKLADARTRLSEVEGKASELAVQSVELERFRRIEEDARERYTRSLKQFSEIDLTRTFEAGRVEVVKPARVPDKPLWPSLPKVLAAALLLGLVAGVAAAFFWESLDDSVKGAEELNYVWHMPVLGLIPHLKEPPPQNLPAEMLAGRRSEIEAFRMLAVSVDLVAARRKSAAQDGASGEASVIMVSSAGPREGKSLVSFYLSLTLAMAGKRVLAIDADLRRKGYTGLAGMTDAGGLAHWFRHGGSLDKYVVKLPGTEAEKIEDGRDGSAASRLHLDVLPAGRWDKSPTLMLRQHAMDVLLEEAKSRYDYIIIDVPPLSFVSDALVVARFRPLVVVVARIGVTSKRLLRRSRDVIQTAGLTPIGAVINEFDAPGVRYGYHYRYYGYYYPYYGYHYGGEEGEDSEDSGARQRK